MTGDHLKALMGLQAATPVLIALYDPHDRLRYANEAFRSAYHVGEDEAPTWAEIMRRNHAAGRGTVLKTDDLEAWIAATVHRRGKVPPHRRDRSPRRPLALDDGDRGPERLDALHRR